MKKRLLIAAATLALIGGPAIADHHGGGHGDGKAMKAPETRAEVESRVKAHFAMIDANKDGAITAEEMSAQREAMRAKMQDRHFASMDSNGDGSISRAEFDAGHAAKDGDRKARRGKHGMETPGGMMMMRAADADKDGKVTLAEATGMALDRFDRVDSNKDGTISAEERATARSTMKDKWRERRGKRTNAGA